MNRFRRLRSATAILVLTSLSAALPAQHVPPPTLEQILEQLEANLNHYDKSVPGFFCDEHVVSQVAPGRADQNTVTDSIFRLKRIKNPDQTTSFDEAREVKSANGHPAQERDLVGPTVLTGAFEGGLAVVSLSQRSCMNYDLEHIKRNAPGAPYVIRFASVLTPQNAASCLLDEDSKGRAFIDTATMQITRLELTTPRHTIIRGDAWESAVTGRRVVTVDYAPISLGGETFWMPSVISSSSTSGAGTFHQIAWHFKAKYSNFHKLEVTSRVVPASEATVPEQRE